ncbi:MAG: type II toxin-antitoxin system VapC family toxin [Saprospirales bacterium]|jgi:tRNA(fMet)-specific endonuclease VapC|nr:type II toxin-antitoxin system VapC family toxin [Saprospirales bacterium]MBK8923647.1 type II toxin-antitoxin system VapC family toxin [Saprospirales bacterium]
MRKFVLDTNIVLAYIRQSPQYLEAEKRLNLTSDDAQLIVSVVTIGEIRVLARRNGWGEKKMEQLNSFIEQVLFVVDVSSGAPELLEAYVDIDCFSNDRSMGKNDLWIAATAKVTESTLVTTDGDFDHLGGVHVQLAKV